MTRTSQFLNHRDHDREYSDTGKKLRVSKAWRNYEHALVRIKTGQVLLQEAIDNLESLGETIASSTTTTTTAVGPETTAPISLKPYIVIRHLRESQYDIDSGSSACMPIAILCCLSALNNEIESHTTALEDIMYAGARLWKLWKTANGAHGQYALFSEVMDVLSEDDMCKRMSTMERSGCLVDRINARANSQEVITKQWTSRQYTLEESMNDFFDSSSNPISVVFTCRKTTIALWKRTRTEAWIFDSHACTNDGMSIGRSNEGVGGGGAGAVLIRTLGKDTCLHFLRDRFPVSADEEKSPMNHTFSLSYTMQIIQLRKS